MKTLKMRGGIYNVYIVGKLKEMSDEISNKADYWILCDCIFISAILGIVYYQFNSKHITEMTRQNLEFYAEQLTVNMDNMVESMKQVTDYIVSDPDMLSAIQAMPRYHETGADQERKNREK